MSSTMLRHITLKDHIIIQELFKRSPVGFLKSTGNQSRSGLQEAIAFSPDSSPLVLTILVLTT